MKYAGINLQKARGTIIDYLKDDFEGKCTEDILFSKNVHLISQFKYTFQ